MTRELSKTVNDKYLSATYIKAYLECPWKFKNIYIDGMETPPSEPLLVGSATHWLMEELIKNHVEYEQVEVDDIYSILSKYVTERAKREFRDIEEEWVDRAVRLVLGFFEYNYDYINGLNILAPEVYISKKITDTDWMLQGTIDALVADGTIIDWKTAARRWPPFRKYKELQPKVYRFLALEDKGYVVTGDDVQEIDIPKENTNTFKFNIFIKHKVISEDSYQLEEKIVVGEDDIAGVDILAKYVADSIDDGRFPCIGPYTGAYCKTCPVREAGKCKIYKDGGS